MTQWLAPQTRYAMDTTIAKKPIKSGNAVSSETCFFYIPGVFGDEPKQSVLREKIFGECKVRIAELPGLNFDKTVLCDLSETARIITEDIMRLQQHGDINLIGFSFGASLAVEIARHLTSAGRTVGFFGLIDCPLKIEDMRRSVRGIVELFAAPNGMILVSKNFIQVFKRMYNQTIASKFLGKKLNLDELAECRFAALRSWKPESCETQGVILLSIFNFERSHTTWQMICPKCKQIKIRSDHHHVLTGHSLDRVVCVMRDEINAFLQQSK